MEDNKDILKILNSIDKIDPFATYLSDESLCFTNKWVDTGSMMLNAVCSGSLYGGIPIGKITSFCGPSQTGKSFIIQNLIKNAQKAGMYCILFDTECAIEPDAAARFGIDLAKVKYVQPKSVLAIRNAINNVLNSVIENKQQGKIAIFIDSIANAESEMQINRMEKDSNSADMGSFAKDVKSLLKTCSRLCGPARCPIVFTNHVYEDPSAMFTKLVKDQPGGKAVWFLPSIIVQMARADAKQEETKEELVAGSKKISGSILKFMTAKNRFIRPYLTGEMYLSYNKGLHKYYGLTELAKALGIVISSGPTYSLADGTKLGYLSKWQNDKQLWETIILPQIEEKIKTEWAYSSIIDEDKPDDNIVPNELQQDIPNVLKIDITNNNEPEEWEDIENES